MKKLTFIFFKNKINITNESIEVGIYEWLHTPFLPSYLIENKTQIQEIVFKISPECWTDKTRGCWVFRVPEPLQRAVVSAVQRLEMSQAKLRFSVYRHYVKRWVVGLILMGGLCTAGLGGWYTTVHAPTPLPMVVQRPNVGLGRVFFACLTVGVPLEKIEIAGETIQVQVRCQAQEVWKMESCLKQLGVVLLQKREWGEAAGVCRVKWAGTYRRLLRDKTGRVPSGKGLDTDQWMAQLTTCVTEAGGQVVGRSSLSVSLAQSDKVLAFLTRTLPTLQTPLSEWHVEVVGTDLKVGWAFDA